MTSTKKAKAQAEALITRLEDLVLGTPASELRAASIASGAVDTVRRIIAEQLAVNEDRGARSSARRADQDLIPVAGRHGSTVSHARAIFGKDGSSAQDKVEELISNLSKDRKKSKGSDKK